MSDAIDTPVSPAFTVTRDGTRVSWQARETRLAAALDALIWWLADALPGGARRDRGDVIFASTDEAEIGMAAARALAKAAHGGDPFARLGELDALTLPDATEARRNAVRDAVRDTAPDDAPSGVAGSAIGAEASHAPDASPGDATPTEPPVSGGAFETIGAPAPAHAPVAERGDRDTVPDTVPDTAPDTGADATVAGADDPAVGTVVEAGPDTPGTASATSETTAEAVPPGDNAPPPPALAPTPDPGLPRADAPGAWDLQLVDPGPDPTRTLALIDRVEGAHAPAGGDDSTIARSLPAHRVRAIYFAVAPATGAALQATPSEPDP